MRCDLGWVFSETVSSFLGEFFNTVTLGYQGRVQKGLRVWESGLWNWVV